MVMVSRPCLLQSLYEEKEPVIIVVPLELNAVFRSLTTKARLPFFLSTHRCSTYEVNAGKAAAGPW